VNSRKSFESLAFWRKEADALGAGSAHYVLCGNKGDVGKRVISLEEAAKYAAAHGMQYFETSAKDGDNVTEMFHALFARTVQKLNL
jgi:GTPase SAR1 family protein